jgi:hypothetical protein
MIETIEDINDLFKQYITENMFYTNFIEYESITDQQKKRDWVYNYMSLLFIDDLIEMYWTNTIEINDNVITEMNSYILGCRNMITNSNNCLKNIMITYFKCYLNLNIYIERDGNSEFSDVDAFVEYIDSKLFNKKHLK